MKEERLRQKLDEIEDIYSRSANEDLLTFEQGVLAGISQVLLWILSPDDWAEPLSTISGLRS